MATVEQTLTPGSADFLSTAFPALTKNGTNFPVLGLAYDATAVESAYWPMHAARYGSGNVTVNVEWYAVSATTGNVVWGAQIAAVTPDTDTGSVESKAMATAATVTDAHLGTTAQRLHRAVITVTATDSLAADDDVWIRIYRDATNGSDTMTGDAVLALATVTYSDT